MLTTYRFISVQISYLKFWLVCAIAYMISLFGYLTDNLKLKSVQIWAAHLSSQTMSSFILPQLLPLTKNLGAGIDYYPFLKNCVKIHINIKSTTLAIFLKRRCIFIFTDDIILYFNTWNSYALPFFCGGGEIRKCCKNGRGKLKLSFLQQIFLSICYVEGW